MIFIYFGDEEQENIWRESILKLREIYKNKFKQF